MASIDIFGKDGIIDLSGGKNLNQLIKGITELSNGFEELEKNLLQFKKASDEVDKSLKDKAKDLKKVVVNQKEYNETVEETEKQAKDINKQYKDNKKVQDQLDKSLKDLKKSQEELNSTNTEAQKIATQREKLEKKLQQTTSGQTDELIKLRVQQQEANKQAKDRAKESLGLVDAYTKESKRLNELRKSAKNAAIQFGKNSKQFNELRKEVINLDEELKDLDKSLGQNQREVGNYSNAIEDLEGRLSGLDTSFDQTIGGLKQLGQAIKKSPLAIIGAAVGSLGAAFTTTEEGEEALEKTTAVLNATLATTVGTIGQFVNIITKIDSFGSLKDAFQELGNLSETYNKRLEESVKAQLKAQEEARNLRIANIDNGVALSELSKAYEILTQASGDATLSLDQQREANVKAAAVASQIAALELDQASKQLSIEKERLAAIEESGKSSVSAREAVAEAEKALIEAQTKALTAEKQLATERRQIAQDDFEQRLDFLIDIADNQKTVNERLIADEKLTLEQRRNIFKDTQKLVDESFKQQIDLFNEQAKTQVDVNKLLTETNANVLFDYIKGLELSEIETNRLLEVIRERKTATQDLADANRDLKESELEGQDLETRIKLLKELNQEAQNGATNLEEFNKKVDEELEKQDVKSLKTRISLLEKGSLERLQLEEELAEKELEINKRKLEERKKQEEQAAKDKKEIDDKLAEEQIARDERLAQAQAGAAGAAGEILQGKIKNEIAGAVVSAVLGAIENGEDPTQALGKAAFIKSALLALTGFEKGGLVEGGEQIVRINEKGQEFVLDAPTTKALGLNKKGSSMADFHNVLQNDLLAKDKRISDNINDKFSPKPIVVENNIDYDKMGQSIAKYMPKEQLKNVAGLLAHEVYEGNTKKTTIIKDKNRILKTY